MLHLASAFFMDNSLRLSQHVKIFQDSKFTNLLIIVTNYNGLGATLGTSSQTWAIGLQTQCNNNGPIISQTPVIMNVHGANHHVLTCCKVCAGMRSG